MSLQEALNVVWTPRQLFRRIGDLLDEGVITERDLAWAAFMADTLDYRIRQAARTILANKLTLPVVSTNSVDAGPRVITVSNYVRTEERWSFGEFFFLIGLIVGGGISFAIAFVQEWLKGTLTIPVLIGILVLLVLASWYLRKQGTKTFREYEAYKKGREGEDRIAERAVADLNGGWTIYRNFILPDRKRDIDLLLVGQGGVIALEIKTYGAGTKLTRSQSKLRLWQRDKSANRQAPDAAIGKCAAELKGLLLKRNCQIEWVQAILVFAEYQPSDFVRTATKTDVWSNSEVDDRLVYLRNTRRLNEQEVARIVTELNAMSKLAS
jgi:hypothetical protein